MKTLETVLLPDTKQILRFLEQLSVLLTAFMSWETNSILQTRDPGLYRQSSSQQTSEPPKRFIWWWYIWDRPTYISKTAPNLVLLSTTHTNHAFPSDLIIRLIFLNADWIMRQCGCYLETDRYLHMKAVTLTGFGCGAVLTERESKIRKSVCLYSKTATGFLS